MTWSFLTNHALVLLCVAEDSRMRLRDIADCVDITERAAHRIVTELEDAGYLTRHHEGNRNHYEVHPDVPLRRSSQEDRPIGDLLTVLMKKPPPKGSAEAA